MLYGLYGGPWCGVCGRMPYDGAGRYMGRLGPGYCGSGGLRSCAESRDLGRRAGANLGRGGYRLEGSRLELGGHRQMGRTTKARVREQEPGLAGWMRGELEEILTGCVGTDTRSWTPSVVRALRPGVHRPIWKLLGKTYENSYETCHVTG